MIADHEATCGATLVAMALGVVGKSVNTPPPVFFARM